MKKSWVWIAIVGVLVVVVIGANLILAYVAISDPSFAVEEDYYQKALRWDDKRAQDLRNTELGWTIRFDLADRRAPDGTLELHARLTDAEGNEIPDAKVTVETFHNARAARIVRADLLRGEDGEYRAALPIFRPGLWEFRFQATRGNDRFTHAVVKEVGWR